MAKRRIIRRQRRIIAVPKECYFDKEKKEPVFTEPEVLRRFTTERAKIIPRSRSGLCAKHQRALTREIKHGRHLALLPFAGHH